MRLTILPLASLLLLAACQKRTELVVPSPAVTLNARQEAFDQFAQVGQLAIGGLGAAEISAFDGVTNRLFVVNNSAVNKIDVVDLSNPAAPVVINSISMGPYGGFVNSVSVHKGKLAAAIENSNKQLPGKVVVFDTYSLDEIKQVVVGALPDMVTFSPDGRFILSANEGEPNSNYTVDPVGSVSVISVHDDYSVVTLDFSSFAADVSALKAGGLRVFGPNASFAQDMEPEYITVSKDSRTAWVTLQENNAIARINLLTKTVEAILPLGFKDFQRAANAFDPTDRPLGTVLFGSWPVRGMYQPDAIAVLEKGGVPYLFTANEGDAREYGSFTEEGRVSSLNLDPVAFPNAAQLKLQDRMGRLNVTKTMGDVDGDGDYDQLYAFGGRSLSVWNGATGSLLWDSGNELEKKAHASLFYDDDRSDNKGVEPEGITVGRVGNRILAFVGMERADAVAIYDVSTPAQPVFLQVLRTGDAPEGVLFVEDTDSPTHRSLLIVSSENDGVIRIYSPLPL